VDPDLEIKAYYAGHVLGAAMFQVKVHHQSIVYTGDYNMTPDRHLGSAWIDKCRPDLLITESTYATTIRDSKRCRERDFLKKISECMDRDGKVLIPVFALGRAQELCILLETYWERMNLLYPIYFSAGLTEKANHYYKLFISWTNQNIKNTFVQRNMFDFKHIKPFDRSYIDNPGPMVVFATPGMLHAGLSLQIFKKWAEDDNNMLIMPGYCVAGTVGHKILSGHKKIEIDKKMVTVRLSVQYMSFSAHADAKGIMQLIRQADPANVMLVHGEAAKMDFLRQKIMQEFGVHCFMPANGEMVSIATKPMISVDVSRSLLKRTQEQIHSPLAKKLCPVRGSATMSGLLVMRNESLQLMSPAEARENLGLPPHSLTFSTTVTMETRPRPPTELVEALVEVLQRLLHDQCVCEEEGRVVLMGTSVRVEVTSPPPALSLLVSWSYQDETLGDYVLSSVQRNLSRLL
jgi:integrator complex subunit 11